jgi:hypothetical protein
VLFGGKITGVAAVAFVGDDVGVSVPEDVSVFVGEDVGVFVGVPVVC